MQDGPSDFNYSLRFSTISPPPFNARITSSCGINSSVKRTKGDDTLDRKTAIPNHQGADFCVDALEEALARYGRPEIFNTDQGGQFTSDAFTNTLQEAGIQISMDGKGRWMDNVMIERLWRSLKYECIYLHAFETSPKVRKGLKSWIDFYNTRRPHSSLDDRTPDEAYWQKPRPGHAGPALRLAA